MEQVSRGNCQLNQDPTPPAHLLPELRPELLPAEEKKALKKEEAIEKAGAPENADPVDESRGAKA